MIVAPEETIKHTASPEVLAPAGNEEMMHAAVENGADAVYFGVQSFNARLRAANFTIADLPNIMSWLHERGVKGYVTMNTLVFTSEMEEAAKTLLALSDAGVDAVLIQDLGLAALARQLVPDLHVHASTQMTLSCAESVRAVDALGLGLTRVVAPRELSRRELAALLRATEKEVEVFVHGALCVAYSGQCLTSEALGGRSANRGECAQACRLPYDLIVDGKQEDLADVRYLLSPKDLAAVEDIGDLAKIGIVSLKIEGRLKSPQYVAATVQSYRAAVEAATAGERPRIDEPMRRKLEQTFSRGFTPGYLHDTNHQTVVEGRFPKKRGLYLGRVYSANWRGVLVELEGPLKPGDGVVFDSGNPDSTEQGGRIYTMHRGETRITKFDPLDGESHCECFLTFGEGAIDWRRINEGDRVWKTSDPALDAELAASYEGEKIRYRRPVSALVEGRAGEPLRLTLHDWDGLEVTLEDSAPAEVAQKRPLTEEVLRDQIGRMGGTPFELGELEARLDGAVMVPMSRLNELRRRAVEALMEKRRAIGTGRRRDEGALARMRSTCVSRVRAMTTQVDPGLEPTESLPSPEILIRKNDNLPHWTRIGATYAVTFRLADSLPQSLLESYRSERESIIQEAEAAGRPLTDEEETRLAWLYSAKVESYLDTGSGECLLAKPEIAEIVAQALRFFDAQRYTLFAWAVMPNHVHVLFEPMNGFGLESILHSWKSFTSKEINRELGRTGQLWQRESYDRIVRDDAEFAHHVGYIVGNPEAAGLKNWKWMGQRERKAQGEEGTIGSPARTRETQVLRPHLAALCRTLEQVSAAVAHGGVDTIYTDFEDIRLHREARALIPRGGPRFVPATIRIVKPGEAAFIRILLKSEPDAILVRNLAAWEILRHEAPDLPLIADYSLNIANDLTAALLYEHGMFLQTPSYDLNIDQLMDLLRAAPAHWFEITIHQYMPMFHMEHCVFCRFLSTGTDFTNCGRPCESHSVAVRDRMGYSHPVKADAGCRNTVFNATAQSGSEYLSQMLEVGVRRFRIDFLEESAAQVRGAIDAYLPAIRGEVDGHDLWKRLRAKSKLGVTKGSLDHE